MSELIGPKEIEEERAESARNREKAEKVAERDRRAISKLSEEFLGKARELGLPQATYSMSSGWFAKGDSVSGYIAYKYELTELGELKSPFLVAFDGRLYLEELKHVSGGNNYRAIPDGYTEYALNMEPSSYKDTLNRSLRDGAKID